MRGRQCRGWVDFYSAGLTDDLVFVVKHALKTKF